MHVVYNLFSINSVNDMYNHGQEEESNTGWPKKNAMTLICNFNDILD